MPTNRVPVAVVVLALSALVGGCSGRDTFPELHPLTGTVTRDGKPVTGGGLIFVLDSGERSRLVVNAAVERDGSFTARTERIETEGTAIRSGAPAGRYKVIYHPPSNGSKTGLEVELDARVTVEAKPNSAEIALAGKMPEGQGVPRDDDPPAQKPVAKGQSKSDE